VLKSAGFFGFGNGRQVVWAGAMKSCQIWVGNVPPATSMPCTLRISRSAFG
jgi:hypothetical protein